MRRLGTWMTAFLLFGLFAVAGAPSAVIAQTDTANKVVDYETIFASLDADGSLRSVRLVDQLRVFGEGDILVTDPAPTEDFRNLSGTGDPEVGEGTVDWPIQDLSGSAEFLTASTPAVDPPLSMVVAYYLNGEPIDGPDLVGSGGTIDMAFDVSNTTSQSMEVTYEDGAGNTRTAIEQVPIPMVAELQMELEKERFSVVEAPGADIITDPNGNLVVRWSMVMVPPIGELTQSFTVRLDTEDFQLGPVRLTGVPVAPRDRPFLAFAEEELESGHESAASLFAGSGELSSNLEALHDGTLDLLDGMQQLFDGSKELATGLQEAASGSGRLAEGAGEATVGSGQLTAGLGDALSGSSQITGGLTDLSKGLKRLFRGAQRLADGLPAAQAGATEIALGAQALDVALAALKAGLEMAETGGVQISAGAAAIRDCLVGGGTPCSGNPSVNAIAGQIAGGAGQIETGAGQIQTGAGQIEAGAGQIQAGAGGIQGAAGTLEGACIGDTGAASCPTVAAIAAAISAGAGDIGTGAGAIVVGAQGIGVGAGQIVGGAQSIQTGAVGIQSIVAGLAAALDQIIAGAQQIEGGLGQAIAGIGLPSDAPDASIRGGLNAIRQGALQLADGMADAIAGIGDEDTPDTLLFGANAASEGADLLRAGSAQLTSGLGEAHSGSGELTAGLTQISDGAGQLASGLGEASSGSSRLSKGIGDAKDGAQQIEQGVYLVNEVGVKEVSASANETAAELDRTLQFMHAQDERAANESLLYGPPSSDQAEVVVGGSGVVLTMDALDARSAESTARGIGALIALVILGGLLLVIRGVRRTPSPA
ncbi:MAG TPA: hypothetical protein VF097_09405 [Actinomycetota bacterium]